MSPLSVTWPYVLRRGHSDDPSQGACAMDAINWLVHGKHGDAPACACPVISAYVRQGNDEMPTGIRQRLLGYLHRIAGSRCPAHRAARLRVLVLAAARVFAPRAMDAAGLHELATWLRGITDDAELGNITSRLALVATTATTSGGAGIGAVIGAAMSAANCIDLAQVDAIGAARFAAVCAARAASVDSAGWDDYFAVLDAALAAGPQGEPWSADAVEIGVDLYRQHGGRTINCEVTA